MIPNKATYESISDLLNSFAWFWRISKYRNNNLFCSNITFYSSELTSPAVLFRNMQFAQERQIQI